MAIKKPNLQVDFQVKDFDTKSGTFAGVASPFGELDYQRDIVMPGAFAKSIAEFEAKGRKVPMLWQHDRYNPIGIYTSLKETATALEVVGQCNLDVQQGRECHALMKQGALTGLSIGYSVITEEHDDDNLIRKLHEVKLYEISPVTFPAADSARAVAKSLEGISTLADCESCLRDAGYSRSEALAFVARVKAIATQSDSADAGAVSIQRAIDILRAPRIQ